MPKRATTIVLSEKEQEALTRISKRHRSEQQLVVRARIVLAAAQGQANVQITRELDINVDTVRLWRDRWARVQAVDLKTLPVEARLQDEPRPGVAPGLPWSNAARSRRWHARPRAKRDARSASGQGGRSPRDVRCMQGPRSGPSKANAPSAWTN